MALLLRVTPGKHVQDLSTCERTPPTHSTPMHAHNAFIPLNTRTHTHTRARARAHAHTQPHAHTRTQMQPANNNTKHVQNVP